MKKVFIIHGWDGNPDEAWLKWLRLELEKRDVKVVAPQMPNAEAPEIGEWVSFLENLVGTPDEETFFVGHSIGCQTILRYLETIHPQKVGGAVLIAGWFHLINLEDAESEAIAKPWIETPMDFEKIKSVTGNIRVILSDNDEWVPISEKEIFEEKLNAEVLVKHLGHFTEDDGVAELPEVLEYMFGRIVQDEVLF